jgi:hypothetical protein
MFGLIIWLIMRTNKVLLLFCVLLVGAAGCVERKLTINTNPAGAQVFLNDEEIGVSPVTASFNWYGDYNITIRKQGCETLQTHRKLQAPWYDLFPFDFLTQILYPGRIVDSYEWSFDLKSQKEISRQELIEAAEQIKDPNAP